MSTSVSVLTPGALGKISFKSLQSMRDLVEAQLKDILASAEANTTAVNAATESAIQAKTEIQKNAISMIIQASSMLASAAVTLGCTLVGSMGWGVGAKKTALEANLNEQKKVDGYLEDFKPPKPVDPSAVKTSTLETGRPDKFSESMHTKDLLPNDPRFDEANRPSRYPDFDRDSDAAATALKHAARRKRGLVTQQGVLDQQILSFQNTVSTTGQFVGRGLEAGFQTWGACVKKDQEAAAEAEKQIASTSSDLMHRYTEQLNKAVDSFGNTVTTLLQTLKSINPQT